MSHDNDAHQLRIRKLQERLSSISSGLRKDLTTEIQNRKQNETSTVYSSTVSSSEQIQQKQPYHKAEKESSVEEILQQLKQIVEHERLETRTMETQQKQIPHDKEPDRGLKTQESNQSLSEQNIVPNSKQWQPWKFIPREKLSHLEKKTLNKFFKKH
jgi:hypothetical protein